MTIRIAIDHTTIYRYDRRVTLSPHIVRLRPAPHCRTPIVSYSLNVEPKEHFINWQQDAFGNYLARLVFNERATELSVRVDLVADMVTINPFDFFIEDSAFNFPFEYDDQNKLELAPYVIVKERGPLLMKWLQKVDRRKRANIDFLVDLNAQIAKDVGYTIRMEPGVQSSEETLKKGTGSCRDSAWLLAQILRHLGFASRFVSGYLVQLTADVKALDGPSGPEADFTDLHAWTEVYLPGAGWVGLDPTSGLFAGEGHIPLACTPDPSSAAAITGAVDECETEFYFHNRVMRIHEDPRVTKPYTELQWSMANALGQKVDQDLEAMDVRLTMGGEPTFVSIDDMDSAQWNTAALGEHKLQLASDLLGRLREIFGKQGTVHYGQGKWYPGEPLPRWAFGLFWRTDGKPLWHNPKWLAVPTKPQKFSRQDAQRFAERLTLALGLDAKAIISAFEDPLAILKTEADLPVNLDFATLNLDDDEERRRFIRVVSQGVSTPVGFVLPLRRHPWGATWQTSSWPLRRERLYLIPGDSPMGFRLPLNALPWMTQEAVQHETATEIDPFAEKPALADAHAVVGQRLSSFTESVELQTRTLQKPIKETDSSKTQWSDVIKTALCFEIRKGNLHIFLPPLNNADDYAELVAAIELTASELQMPIYLEGYDPPRDERLERIHITPDPGVIEVNIHPAKSWSELVQNTSVLYEQARLSRLGTEKFMLDGRHTGTGGGNHVTLGGKTPADSPLLRRPDLLASLLTYWQHHPALSYLFSGLFLGPTSQAPRVDEARDELLYELEIALQRLPKGDVPLWIVDRLFRNLLVDLTGNTHRAEFCIDKLYSPDGPAGRLGVLEMRGFEMPPHPQMSLVQILLIRSLVAMFWKKPYRHKLVRWGTSLHDQFMLPHFVRRDMQSVLNDLKDAGYPFLMEWLDPFFEFRFPVAGRLQVDEIELTLRLAIEPWHVLGEEATGTGTARYVDSSVERLEVKITNMTENRHVLACNGRRVPLHSTGVKGEFVAGVRFRAWQPPSALHPTIPVDVPLVFDIVDQWTGRAISGCTYHVAHPGGRAHEQFPVNANTAESRRGERFFPMNHTPGTVPPPPEYLKLRSFYPHGVPDGPYPIPPKERNADYPRTLDLRRLRE